MKVIASFCAGILLMTLVLAVVPANGEQALYDAMIRLHILANSDSEEDQRIKLEVRDAVLAYFADAKQSTGASPSVEVASEQLAAHLDEVKRTADVVLAPYGYTAEVAYGREQYPTRYYEDIELPAGEYRSLRVIIEDGAGKNWWCVLFPPLCLAGSIQSEESESELEAFIAAGLTPEQYQIIKEEKTPVYRIKFKILELLAGLFQIEY